MNVEMAMLVSGSPTWLDEVRIVLSRDNVRAHLLRPPIGELNA
jgi:hypothetical protein